MKSIFDELFLRDVCFSVIVSTTTFRNKSIDVNSHDYFILAKYEDRKQLKGLKFVQRSHVIGEHDIRVILAHDMIQSEIDAFKRISDRFVKTHHTEDGKVYEVWGDSFLAYYKKGVRGVQEK